MMEVVKLLDEGAAEREKGKVAPMVFHPRPQSGGIRVHKEGDTFVIAEAGLERIIARVDISQPEVYAQVRKQMDRIGISRELKQAGARPGDKVRCGDFEWDWR